MSPDDYTDDPLEAQEADDWGDEPEISLEEEIQAELRDMRKIMAEFSRLLIAKARTADDAEELTRLSNAANKTTQAHRRIAVLQLEVAGKRPLPNTRAPREAAAGRKDAPSPEEEPRPQDERFPKGLPFWHGDYADYDDYTDEERREAQLRRVCDHRGPLITAMNEDFTAAGHEDIVHQSALTKFKLIYYIPHPNLDRAVAEADPLDVIFGFLTLADNLPPVAGTGPPEVWEQHNERCRPEWEGPHPPAFAKATAGPSLSRFAGEGLHERCALKPLARLRERGPP